MRDGEWGGCLYIHKAYIKTHTNEKERRVKWPTPIQRERERASEREGEELKCEIGRESNLGS